jgi:hypothetical protein
MSELNEIYSNTAELIYELIKSQCNNNIVASSIDRKDLIALSGPAQAIMSDVDTHVNSQRAVYTKLVTDALANESLVDIFNTQCKSNYNRLLHILAVSITLVEQRVHEKNDTIVDELVAQIQQQLNDRQFMTDLFADPTYIKKTKQPSQEKDCANLNVPIVAVSNPKSTYLSYGFGTLVVGTLATFAVVYLRSKK